ncbi:MAG: hypothetical protein DKT66_19090 [Candidatus Melainabacteria bacterium]|nr:MAG: hypothetical protein DKT66_19090 [Candidatus Melainabacteria bacterium]
MRLKLKTRHIKPKSRKPSVEALPAVTLCAAEANSARGAREENSRSFLSFSGRTKSEAAAQEITAAGNFEMLETKFCDPHAAAAARSVVSDNKPNKDASTSELMREVFNQWFKGTLHRLLC